MKRAWLLSLAVLAAGCSSQVKPPVSTGSDLSNEERARALVARMTLDEKISQIHMMDMKGHPREVAGVDRLGVPIFKITNGPAGAGPGDKNPTEPATALPAEIALGASWDPELAGEFGKLAGMEVRDRGEHLLEGPGLNITRVPQNGRNFEYYGEDPYLSGMMAVAEVKGIQSQNVISEIKHFAANNQETNRKSINEIVDERTLREIYLPAFERAVKEADPGAVMAAYPSVNGNFCSQNPHLLKEILRGDWGFKGFVQSDYTGTRSAVLGAAAGLDLSMKADRYGPDMKTAVSEGAVKETQVDEMVVRRFAQMFRFGMFDDPRKPVKIPAREDGAIARKIAAQCVVLLRNEGGMLPLAAGHEKTIAVIGPYAATAQTGGTGSSMVKPLYTVSPVEGIQNRVGPNVHVAFCDGENLATAASMAASADVVLLMVGDKDGEGHDRPNLTLPRNQDGLVKAVAAANVKTVVVLTTGGPVLMPWIDNVPAVVEAWYPGEEDGNVVADILFGDVNPSGKLAMTFPKAEKDTPAHTPEQWPGVKGVATYSEKLEVGYRWYDAEGVEPLFPFGFGLSYTTFEVKNLSVSGKTVSVDISNTGKRDGADVVQVYVADPEAAGEPPKQLRAFKKVMLKAGETQHVEMTLDARAFSVWDESINGWKVVSGKYQIMAGDSSRDLPLKSQLSIAEK